ncbi:MAG: RNA-binding S4 domain-containing protein [Clostridiales Family XIII bacterium]|nr:RNA-binding S4 domain-containing protein [Clostridiales Family XIII bacterium]
MRIDKYLKNSRLIKRRSIAKEACDRERVFINGKPAKAGSEVKIGDEVLIRFGGSEVKVRVAELKESTKKEDAASMYEVIA